MRNIAIVAGGNSSEFGVSIKSAELIKKELDPAVFRSFVVLIKGRQWQVMDGDNSIADINKDDFSFLLNGQKICFDCALISIHGTPGENGILQSYFELIELPYTTCGVLSSALTFNKYLTKLVVRERGVNTAKEILVNRNQPIDEAQIVKSLGLPCFVKPNESGSSFGVTKVNNANEFPEAFKAAFAESCEVLVESFLQGTEVSCGIFRTSKRTFVFPVTEIIPKSEFFDKKAKYDEGMSEEITPARLSSSITQNIQNATRVVYDALNCRGLVRVDFILCNNQPYMLEVNTVPGMSPRSIIPQQIKVAGMTVSEVYKEIIEDMIALKNN